VATVDVDELPLGGQLRVERRAAQLAELDVDVSPAHVVCLLVQDSRLEDFLDGAKAFDLRDGGINHGATDEIAGWTGVWCDRKSTVAATGIS
jgi:hypothetical protein